MTIHITPLITHYSTEQAVELIALLDTLRDALWNTYGEQIKQMHCQHCSLRNCEQCELDFDDDIPF
jgi:hypothetical protein